MAIASVKETATVRSRIVALAQSQVGYKETGNNHTKYAQYFDTPKSKGGPYPWFNGKKQNTPWCSIFVNWDIVMVLATGDNKVLKDPDAVRIWLGYPSPANNCAAGCPYMWGYLVKKGWQVSKTAGRPGDIIFFNTTSKCGHVGLIEKVDNGNYYTIEGNKSNMVKRCSYTKSSSSIYGIISPNYESFDKKPEPEPTPTPTPTPTTTDYKVKTNGGTLTLRAQPTTNSRALATIKNGTTIAVSEIVKGEAVGGNTDWAKTTYNGDTGYCSCRWLEKVTPAPAPAPTPTPTPKPTYPKYKVTAVHGLNVRRGPGMGYGVVKTLSKGTVVTVYEQKNGWGRIGTAQWCCMTYLQRV